MMKSQGLPALQSSPGMEIEGVSCLTPANNYFGSGPLFRPSAESWTCPNRVRTQYKQKDRPKAAPGGGLWAESFSEFERAETKFCAGFRRRHRRRDERKRCPNL
jgi:hypothetical protein